jgi:hypothetical protein
MMMMALVAVSMTKSIDGFSPTANMQSTTDARFSWALNYVPAKEEDYKQGDDSMGGVGLARESAIKIVGDIQHKPGKADCIANDLVRYTKLSATNEATVQSALKSTESFVLCTGQGVELYKDPGETTNKEVFYGPREAIKDALTNAASAMESEYLVFNFLGGDDLMLGEVTDASTELVLDLDIPTKTKISFNSLSHNTIPSGTCTVTVVSVGNPGDDSLSGIEKAISQGEVYSRDGNWYTVAESDINTAIE